MAVQPRDMRAGTEAALTRVVLVFGPARPHYVYLFANPRMVRKAVEQRQVHLAKKYQWNADTELAAFRSTPETSFMVIEATLSSFALSL